MGGRSQCGSISQNTLLKPASLVGSVRKEAENSMDVEAVPIYSALVVGCPLVGRWEKEPCTTVSVLHLFKEWRAADLEAVCLTPLPSHDFKNTHLKGLILHNSRFTPL